MNKSYIRLFAWLVAPLVVSCGGNNAPPSGDGVIGPEGGQVAAGASASVVIPPGALTTDITITLTPSQAPAPDATIAVDTPYVFGPEGTQFATPVTVTLEVVADLLPADTLPTEVVIYTAPANTTTYEALPTALVDDTHVSAQTSHFSIFVAAVKRKDHGGPDAGAADAAVSVDASVDAATSACTPVKSGGIQACTFSAACNGHTYTAQCAGTSCTCTVGPNGQSQQVATSGQTCLGTDGQPGWSACGFP